MAGDMNESSLVHALSGIGITSKVSQKRKDYIDWENYFMAIACLVSNRSKDPSTQVGACIVNRRNRIVGQGYNGMPRGCGDDDFPWGKTSQNPVDNKYHYVCHAEMNAILNRNCADISNCIIYTLLFPCNQCAKTIIQSGISEVVYLGDKNMIKAEGIASKRMFDASGVCYRQFKPSYEGFKINLKKGVCDECPPHRIEREASYFSSREQSNKKRENCLPWVDYFLAISILVAKRSKSPTLQLGACIVDKENRIVGQGYNGMPHGCSDDVFPWRSNAEDPLDNKDLYECHAELNAILNAGLQVKGCVMYTITYPCNECAKAIIQSGIIKVVYIQSPPEEAEFLSAQKMFRHVGIECSLHTPAREEIFADFSLINT